VNTSRQVGGTLGIAVMGAIVAARESVPPSDPRFATQFLHGFHDALLAGAGIALVGALLSAALVRRVRTAPRSGRLRVAPNE
jgi:drug/metabolite transporter (DMT)-like permease